jgi:hypothetical protein
LRRLRFSRPVERGSILSCSLPLSITPFTANLSRQMQLWLAAHGMKLLLSRTPTMELRFCELREQEKPTPKMKQIVERMRVIVRTSSGTLFNSISDGIAANCVDLFPRLIQFAIGGGCTRLHGHGPIMALFCVTRAILWIQPDLAGEGRHVS